MTGHWLVNYDNNTIGYDWRTQTPFVGELILTADRVKLANEQIAKGQSSFVTFQTQILDQIKIVALPFDQIDPLIAKVETLLEDLKELKVKSQNKP